MDASTRQAERRSVSLEPLSPDQRLGRTHVLTLTFLGVGAAFAKRNFQSNALIEAWSSGPDEQDTPDDTLLVDFGTTGPLALNQLRQREGFAYLDDQGRVNYPAIKRIFVSHLHSDHIGGLEELAAMNIHVFGNPKGGREFKPQLYGSPEVLLNLWDRSMRGGHRLNAHVLKALFADEDAWTLVEAPRVREPAYARAAAPISPVSMVAAAAGK